MIIDSRATVNHLKAQACTVLQIDDSEYDIEFGNTTYDGAMFLDKVSDYNDVKLSKNSGFNERMPLH